MTKNISVLGSTGSIGTQTLEVAKHLGINVLGIAAHSNVELLEMQIKEFKPRFVAVFDETAAKKLQKKVDIKVLAGINGLCEVAKIPEIETVVMAISGLDGVKPTLAAINNSKNIALANKETLVSSGEMVMRTALEKGVKILPVDSEHSAIFQCLNGENKKNIKKIILTASGGPFFGKNKNDLKNITPEKALKHPSWSMGKKISIDSATLMNKGLEVIEAAFLFGLSVDDIEIVIHPESVVHSMVEFVDGSVIAQLGTPTMKTPIQYALTYPNRVKSISKPLNLTEYGRLNFFEPDYETFEGPIICKKAFKSGEKALLRLNKANDEAVKLFLNREISFLEITEYVKNKLNF